MDKTKSVKVSGVEYRISKFSAREGAFLLTKVLGIVGPIVAPLVANAPKDAKPEELLKGDSIILTLGSAVGPLASLDERDFMYLQDKCLSVCEVKFPAGYQPVMQMDGTISAESLEDDSFAVLALMAHALWHNFAGFFAVNPLSMFQGDGNTSATNSPN